MSSSVIIASDNANASTSCATNGKAHNEERADSKTRYKELVELADAFNKKGTHDGRMSAVGLYLEAARLALRDNLKPPRKPYSEPAPILAQALLSRLFEVQLDYAKGLAVEVAPTCLIGRQLTIKSRTPAAASNYSDTSAIKYGAYMEAVHLAIEANMPAERVSEIIPLLRYYSDNPEASIFTTALQKHRYQFAYQFAIQNGMAAAAMDYIPKTLERLSIAEQDLAIAAAEAAFNALKKDNAPAAINVAVEFNLQRYSEVYKRHLSCAYEVIDGEPDGAKKGALVRAAIDALGKAGKVGEAQAVALDYGFFTMDDAQRRQWEILNALRAEARKRKVRRTEPAYTGKELLGILRHGHGVAAHKAEVNALVSAGELEKSNGRYRLRF